MGDELKNQGSWFGKGDVWKSKISHQVDEPMGWVAHRDQVGSKVFKRRFFKEQRKGDADAWCRPEGDAKGFGRKKKVTHRNWP